MGGLVIKLAPNERILINGAIIENGDRRTRISVRTPNAHILRLKDALHPDDVTTPVSRVCYVAQLILTGEADPRDAQPELLVGLEQLSEIFPDPDRGAIVDDAIEFVRKANYYQALRRLRQLLAHEAQGPDAGL